MGVEGEKIEIQTNQDWPRIDIVGARWWVHWGLWWEFIIITLVFVHVEIFSQLEVKAFLPGKLSASVNPPELQWWPTGHFSMVLTPPLLVRAPMTSTGLRQSMRIQEESMIRGQETWTLWNLMFYLLSWGDTWCESLLNTLFLHLQDIIYNGPLHSSLGWAC